MADKSYKLTLSLSDGNIIDAGIITAPQGPTGANGVTFTPSVSSAGILSWTNNGGLTNPSPVNIKGPKGDDAVITESDVAGWGFTKNKGTVTSVSVKMNGTTKGTVTSSGTIDLGTVLTSHQDISGKANLSGGNTFDAQQIFSDTIGTTEISGSFVEIKASSQGSSQFRVLNIHSAAVISITGEESGLIAIEAPIMLGGSKGTAGQVLTSQGANDPPRWVTPAIKSASLSGTTLTITL